MRLFKHRPAKLDKNPIPRKANRAGERTKAFRDADDDLISATVFINSKGEVLNLEERNDTQELILDELRKINLHLSIMNNEEI